MGGQGGTTYQKLNLWALCSSPVHKQQQAWYTEAYVDVLYTGCHKDNSSVRIKQRNWSCTLKKEKKSSLLKTVTKNTFWMGAKHWTMMSWSIFYCIPICMYAHNTALCSIALCSYVLILSKWKWKKWWFEWCRELVEFSAFIGWLSGGIWDVSYI